jgi:Tol biopolymer transport system component
MVVYADGHYIVFYSDRTGNGQIWRMDKDGDSPTQLTYNLVEGSIGGFSPDGKWVVYSKKGAGVWKVPVGGGNPVHLTDAEADYPTVSPDGKLIAYSYNDPSANPPERFASPPRGIAVMASAGSPPKKLFRIPNLTSFRWVADGRSLLYTKNEGGIDNFWNQPIAGGVPKQITHFNNQEIDSFDLSSDGKWLVVSRGTVRQDVVLIRDLR